MYSEKRKKMKTLALLNSAHGTSIASYGIIVGLVSVLAIGAVLSTGDQVSSVFSTANSALSDGGVSIAASGRNNGDQESSEPPAPTCTFTDYTVTAAPSTATADTFVYNYLTDPVQTWDWYQGSSSIQDRLILEEIISPDDVLFINTNNEDMQIIPDNGAQNFIDEQHDDHNRGGFGTIVFCDGTELDRLAIRNKAIFDSLTVGTGNASEQFEEVVYDSNVHSTATYFSLNTSSGIQDRLVFVDINSDEVAFLNSGDYETMRIVMPSTDVLTLNDQHDTGNRYGVGTIVFADGVELNRAEIRNRAAADGMVNGTLFGSVQQEDYVYDSNLHDSVSISNLDISSSVDDTLTFLDVNSADADFTILSDRETMTITVPGGVLSLNDQLDTGNRYGVETVTFADGVIISRGAMGDRAVSDSMETGTVYGTGGQEDYIYTAAIYGSVFVDNTNISSSIVDTWTFTDLALADASLSFSSDLETLVMTVPGGVITLDDQADSSNRHGVGSMTFTDGTLNRQEIRDKAAADSLLSGGLFYGTVKNENYIYTSSIHGEVTFDGINISSSFQDTWTFTDLASTDVIFAHGGDNETLIMTLPGGVAVVIDDQTDTSNRYGVGTMTFTDLSLDRAGILAKITSDAS